MPLPNLLLLWVVAVLGCICCDWASAFVPGSLNVRIKHRNDRAGRSSSSTPRSLLCAKRTAPFVESTAPPDPTLFVNNLARHVGNKDIEHLFSDFGRMKKAFVVRDTRTQVSKGFGIVTYTRASEAAAAKEALNGKLHEGLCLRIDFRTRGATIRILGLSESVGKQELLHVCKAYGRVEECVIMRAMKEDKEEVRPHPPGTPTPTQNGSSNTTTSPSTPSSSSSSSFPVPPPTCLGCGLVTFSSRRGALEAVSGLHNKEMWRGTLSVLMWDHPYEKLPESSPWTRKWCAVNKTPALPGLPDNVAHGISQRQLQQNNPQKHVEHAAPAQAARLQLRLLTYNTLSPALAMRKKHSYTPHRLRAWKLRSRMLADELEHYQRGMGAPLDVICLQEVPSPALHRNWRPIMNKLGLKGVVYGTCHLPEQGEITPALAKNNLGQAIFFDKERFELVAEECTLLRDMIPEHWHTEAPDLVASVFNKSHIAVMVRLTPKPGAWARSDTGGVGIDAAADGDGGSAGRDTSSSSSGGDAGGGAGAGGGGGVSKGITIVNCHQLAEPKAPFIKAAQAHLLLRAVKAFHCKVGGSADGTGHLVVCGDFNFMAELQTEFIRDDVMLAAAYHVGSVSESMSSSSNGCGGAGAGVTAATAVTAASAFDDGDADDGRSDGGRGDGRGGCQSSGGAAAARELTLAEVMENEDRIATEATITAAASMSAGYQLLTTAQLPHTHLEHPDQQGWKIMRKPEPPSPFPILPALEVVDVVRPASSLHADDVVTSESQADTTQEVLLTSSISTLRRPRLSVALSQSESESELKLDVRLRLPLVGDLEGAMRDDDGEEEEEEEEEAEGEEAASTEVGHEVLRLRKGEKANGADGGEGPIENELLQQYEQQQQRERDKVDGDVGSFKCSLQLRDAFAEGLIADSGSHNSSSGSSVNALPKRSSIGLTREFTTKTDSFVGVLDFIFVGTDVTVKEVLDAPNTTHTVPPSPLAPLAGTFDIFPPIPNELWPSDHIAQGALLEFPMSSPASSSSAEG